MTKGKTTKTMVIMEDDLKHRLKDDAQRQRRTMSDQLNYILDTHYRHPSGTLEEPQPYGKDEVRQVLGK